MYTYLGAELVEHNLDLPLSKHVQNWAIKQL